MKSLTFLVITLSVLLTSCVQTNYNNILVTKVFDGDTLRLASGEKVRLIGIDTPETEYSYKEAHYLNQGKKWERSPEYYEEAREATEFTRGLVEGKEVQLEFDLEKKDKYGRLLAYVYLSDGTFVNAEIIRQGYASLMTIPPNVKYADLFHKLYQEAKENKRGLWSEDNKDTSKLKNSGR